MMISGMVVHHQANIYRLALPNGPVVANLRFPLHGDSLEESRIVRIIIKHMKDIYDIK